MRRLDRSEAASGENGVRHRWLETDGFVRTCSTSEGMGCTGFTASCTDFATGQATVNNG